MRLCLVTAAFLPHRSLSCSPNIPHHDISDGQPALGSLPPVPCGGDDGLHGRCERRSRSASLLRMARIGFEVRLNKATTPDGRPWSLRLPPDFFSPTSWFVIMLAGVDRTWFRATQQVLDSAPHRGVRLLSLPAIEFLFSLHGDDEEAVELFHGRHPGTTTCASCTVSHRIAVTNMNRRPPRDITTACVRTIPTTSTGNRLLPGPSCAHQRKSLMSPLAYAFPLHCPV